MTIQFKRNDMKTPYMAIQYGGSSHAISSGGTSAAFTLFCKTNNLITGYAAELAEAAVNEALGSQVTDMIASIEYTVAQLLETKEERVTNVSYTHTDGFVVRTDNSSCQVKSAIDAFSFIFKCAEYDNDGNETLKAKTIDFNTSSELVFQDSNSSIEMDCVSVNSQRTRSETVRKFVVNYVQGIDALIARTVAINARDAGITNYTSIHDCFRCHPNDVTKLQEVISLTYKQLFIEQDQLAHLESQIGEITGYYTKDENFQEYWVSWNRGQNFVTAEILDSVNSYYFGK